MFRQSSGIAKIVSYHKCVVKICYCLEVVTLSRKVPWIVKTDDDTVNDMWQLQQTLEEMQESTSRLIYALLREERFGEKAKKGQ